jgi:hypothetical protein
MAVTARDARHLAKVAILSCLADRANRGATPTRLDADRPRDGVDSHDALVTV